MIDPNLQPKPLSRKEARSMNSPSLVFENLIREAISACRAEKKIAPDIDPDIAERLHEAGARYAEMGKPGQAEELHLQGLAVREQIFGDRHPDVADSLLRLADLYRAEGRAKEAEPRVRRALAIRQRAFGPDHESVARCLDLLVTLYRALGRNGDAEMLAARAQEIRRAETVEKTRLHETAVA
jgi:tetratricopeptide (TPR) repeat protein